MVGPPGSETILSRLHPAKKPGRVCNRLNACFWAADVENDSGPVVRLSSVETRTCRSHDGLGSVHNLTRNPLSPISGIPFDLTHKPSRDRTGGTCALLPRANRVRVDP